MSDKLKRVLDTNLAGLHVTDAQVNAVLRRAYDMPATGNILACGEAVLDLDSAALSIHGQSIPFTRNELIIRIFGGHASAAHSRRHPSGRFPDGGTGEKASGQRGGFAVFSG